MNHQMSHQEELTVIIRKHLQEQLNPTHAINHDTNHIEIATTNRTLFIWLGQGLKVNTRTYTRPDPYEPYAHHTDHTYRLEDPQLLTKLTQAVQELTNP